jgi:hypothetical protein
VLSESDNQELQPLSNIAQLQHQQLLATQQLWDATKFPQQAQCMLIGWSSMIVLHQLNALGNAFQLLLPLQQQLQVQLQQQLLAQLVQLLPQLLQQLVKLYAQLPQVHLMIPHHNVQVENIMTG